MLRPTVRHYVERKYILVVSVKSLLSELPEPSGNGVRKSVRVSGDGGH